ncbi:HD domain-containing protein [Actinoallomurus oryzae]|uniref:HD domain-containing protein n=1 Tax=Actinoallomurus oryzae TaxID=502180 RepID=UPI0031F18EDC
MTSSALDRALRDEAGLRRLPEDVEGLLHRLDAPPRLGAHLRAVHDVACRLLDSLGERFPGIGVDQEAVRYGAATHDVGKAYVTEELSGPGSEHERRGHRLLLDHGVDERLARFAGTHGTWDGADVTFEDLLVSLADKVWKGKRVPDLEQRVVDHLASTAGREPWEVFMALDDLLTELAAGADRRLAFQSAYPITS